MFEITYVVSDSELNKVEGRGDNCTNGKASSVATPWKLKPYTDSFAADD